MKMSMLRLLLLFHRYRLVGMREPSCSVCWRNRHYCLMSGSIVAQLFYHFGVPRMYQQLRFESKSCHGPIFGPS